MISSAFFSKLRYREPPPDVVVAVADDADGMNGFVDGCLEAAAAAAAEDDGDDDDDVMVWCGM